MLEDWIDALCAVWGTMNDGRQNVKSFKLLGRDEFPAAITLPPPTALTFLQNVSMEYSVGGASMDFWQGFTELHVLPASDGNGVAAANKFYTKIMKAAKANFTLGGKVKFFVIGNGIEGGEPAIEGAVALKYGEKAVNVGLVIHWRVFENTSGVITVTG